MPLTAIGTNQTVPKWYLEATSVWGTQHPDDVAMAPEERIPDGPEDARLAYDMVVQLSSRIATNRIQFQAGVEAVALKSVYELFPYARERVVHYGPSAHATASLVLWMLNRDVRPFTAYWHRVSNKGLFELADVCRRFRSELDTLRAGLSAWAGLLRYIYDPQPGRDVLLPDKSVRTGVQINPMAKEPCPRDGLAAPTPFADGYERLVAREWELVKAWRSCTNRDEATLSGIALSGGGIRSATFALGVLRRLALAFPVFAVDYISTVSGGGYLGSLITSAFHNDVVAGHDGHGPLGARDGVDVGAGVIGWLRGRSRTMKLDAKLVASIAGQLVSEKGPADEYEARLRDTWLVGKMQHASLGTVVCGTPSIPLAELSRPSPLQLWNMAINVTDMSPELVAALRGRQADLYTLSRAGAECRVLGEYEPTNWTIERAMALSGAAIAPTSAEGVPGWALRVPAAFGVNMGRWVSSSTGDTERSSFSRHFASLFGRMRSADGTAFISDGGHVENTALYQLLRRRCGLILAIDGEHDPEMLFGGLMKLQHLARVEQRIELDIDLRDLAIDSTGRSDAHFAVIRVAYPQLEDVPAQSGFILYVKLSLTGDEPAYLRDYKYASREAG